MFHKDVYEPNDHSLTEVNNFNFFITKNSKNKLLILEYQPNVPVSSDVFEKVGPYHKILEPTLWADILQKFILPDQTVINSPILPPRKLIFTSLPLRDTSPIYTSSQQSTHSSSTIERSNIKEFDPDNSNALIEREQKYLRHSLTTTTRDNIKDIEPDNANALIERVKQYFRICKYENSILDLDKLLEINPNDAFALTWLIQDGQISRSKINPNDNAALNARGEIYRKIARYGEALTDLNKMLGKYEEALADLIKSLYIKPNDAFALGSRGKTYCKMCRYEEALADINKLLKIEPNNVTVSKIHKELVANLKRK
ncbi:hypothetical protein C2G38_2193796 [Gigaspora rosea]|uniref:TPR-like protein n=1 Tax=Gigaspora rosea TaxID=44941 RepID=A0A397UXC6_9GLOM|nr:hypothetical protein C2G38_2193796 [Gigaspora rosea]